MKHCEYQDKELIALYVDQELTAEEVSLVENHVKDCEVCRTDLDLYTRIHEELSLDDVQLPKNFHEDMMNRLSLENETKEIEAFQVSFFRKYMRYINIAALFTVVVFIGLAGLNRPTNSDMEVATMTTSETTSSEESATEVAYEMKEDAKTETASDSSIVESAMPDAKAASTTLTNDENEAPSATASEPMADAGTEAVTTETTQEATNQAELSTLTETASDVDESMTSSDASADATTEAPSVKMALSDSTDNTTDNSVDVTFNESTGAIETGEITESTDATKTSDSSELMLNTNGHKTTSPFAYWVQTNVILFVAVILLILVLLSGIIGGIIYRKKRK